MLSAANAWPGPCLARESPFCRPCPTRRGSRKFSLPSCPSARRVRMSLLAGPHPRSAERDCHRFLSYARKCRAKCSCSTALHRRARAESLCCQDLPRLARRRMLLLAIPYSRPRTACWFLRPDHNCTHMPVCFCSHALSQQGPRMLLHAPPQAATCEGCRAQALPRPATTATAAGSASTGRPPHPRRTQVRMCVATGIGGGPEPCPGRGTITPRSSQKGDGDQSSAEQSGLALTANRERQAVIGSRSEALPLSRTLAGALDHTQEREQ